uniref:Uncharacterized protein n=1 Tax=Dromaius novaehollandiae TaxID=8790 RepID=A0A8C4IVW6_DRONO
SQPFFCLLSCPLFQGLLAGPSPTTAVCTPNLPFPPISPYWVFSPIAVLCILIILPTSGMSPSYFQTTCSACRVLSLFPTIAALGTKYSPYQELMKRNLKDSH